MKCWTREVGICVDDVFFIPSISPLHHFPRHPAFSLPERIIEVMDHQVSSQNNSEDEGAESEPGGHWPNSDMEVEEEHSSSGDSSGEYTALLALRFLSSRGFNERLNCSSLVSFSVFLFDLFFSSLIIFLSFKDAFSHLYKRVCPSVDRSVRRSVRPSVSHI